jgi:hypothetical protein
MINCTLFFFSILNRYNTTITYLGIGTSDPRPPILLNEHENTVLRGNDINSTKILRHNRKLITLRKINFYPEMNLKAR